MRINYLIMSFLLIPLHAFSQPDSLLENMQLVQTPASDNTYVKSFSNERELLEQNTQLERTIDFPTHVIRLSTSMDGQQLTCSEVNEEIERTIIAPLIANKFIYGGFFSCTYDPKTSYALQFVLNSFFDPTTDESVDYLKSFMDKYNGADFLGTKLTIVPAKGVVISLNIAAGMKKNPYRPPFIQYRQDRSNYHFSSNYEMNRVLLNDIRANFFSNDPNVILPFLNRWFFSYAGAVYKAVLRDSDYVELQPERIFLMEDGKKIFVSEIKYNFIHPCGGYENQRCLEQGN